MLLTQAAKNEREAFLRQCAEIKVAEDAEREKLEQKKRAQLANGKAVVN